MDLPIKKDGQPITYDLLDDLPEKIELDAGNIEKVDKFLEITLFNIGLYEFVKILPQESRKILRDMLDEIQRKQLKKIREALTKEELYIMANKVEREHFVRKELQEGRLLEVILKTLNCDSQSEMEELFKEVDGFIDWSE